MKGFIWIGLFLGSIIGGWIPTIWGSDVFSFSSVIGSAVGGVIGIWAGYKLEKRLF